MVCRTIRHSANGSTEFRSIASSGRYGDGHIAGTRAGLRGGTLLANLRLMRSTGSGALDHARDLRLVEDIDRRGGVVFTFGWPPQ